MHHRYQPFLSIASSHSLRLCRINKQVGLNRNALLQTHPFLHDHICPWENFKIRWCSFVYVLPWLHDLTISSNETLSHWKSYSSNRGVLFILVCSIGKGGFTYLNQSDIYCPHPKDGKGNVFTGDCPFTWGGGGTPVPGSFPGPFQGYPSPGGGGVMQAGGTPVPVEGSYPGLGYLLVRTGLGPPPARTGLGYPPSETEQQRSTCYAAGGMPLAVTEEDFLVSEIYLVFLFLIRNTNQ